MNRSVKKLLDIGSAPLSPLPPEDVESAPQSQLKKDLFELLAVKNGFFAFESALHVFPADRSVKNLNLHDWNLPKLWKSAYRGFAEGSFCFAQDIFGVQHCIKADAIVTFDPETGTTEFLASSIHDWAEKILTDYEYLTGFPVAHRWQKQHGPLPMEKRLMPKTPFVCGGAFEVENLFAVDALQSMQVRADFAVQIKDIPDGETFIFKVVD